VDKIISRRITQEEKEKEKEKEKDKEKGCTPVSNYLQSESVRIRIYRIYKINGITVLIILF
jgi:hypothetical protein